MPDEAARLWCEHDTEVNGRRQRYAQVQVTDPETAMEWLLARLDAVTRHLTHTVPTGAVARCQLRLIAAYQADRAQHTAAVAGLRRGLSYGLILACPPSFATSVHLFALRRSSRLPPSQPLPRPANLRPPADTPLASSGPHPDRNTC